MRKKITFISVSIVLILSIYVLFNDNTKEDNESTLTITKVFYQSLNTQTLILYNDDRCSYQGNIYSCKSSGSVIKIDDIIFYKSGKEFIVNNTLLLTKANMYKIRDNFYNYLLNIRDEFDSLEIEKAEIKDINNCYIDNNNITCTISYNIKPFNLTKYLDENHKIGWVTRTDLVKFDKATKNFIEILNKQ